MDSPSSTRRITRSQTKKSAFSTSTSDFSSKKIDEPKQRACLFDITNDSPIIGLASGNLNQTPISSIVKQKRGKLCKKTPGSGEALLRGQVKNLLQKVEEEAEISKFLSFETGCAPHGLKPFLNSPSALLSQTPANTPQAFNFNSAIDGFESFGSVLESPIQDQSTVSTIINGMQHPQSEKDIISRTLFQDFFDKSDSSLDCSSVLTDLGTKEEVDKEKSPSKDDDDDSSVWSIQVNASTHDEEEVIQDDLEDQLDELCEGIKSITVNEEMTFKGQHIRFVYNSDDELVEEEVEGEALPLKGLPTPKGKHLRFQDEED